MIKALLFDCFGVLTDDGWLAFLRQYGGGPNDEHLHYLNRQADLAQMSNNEFLSQVSHLTGVTVAEARRVINTPHHVNEDLVVLIKALKKHYKIGMISNVGSGHLSDILSEDVLSLFDQITLSYQVGSLKPEPEIYEYALNALDVSAPEAIFIDDRQYNCDGAEAVGMKSIWYQDVTQLTKALQTLGITT